MGSDFFCVRVWLVVCTDADGDEFNFGEVAFDGGLEEDVVRQSVS